MLPWRPKLVMFLPICRSCRISTINHIFFILIIRSLHFLLLAFYFESCWTLHTKAKYTGVRFVNYLTNYGSLCNKTFLFDELLSAVCILVIHRCIYVNPPRSSGSLPKMQPNSRTPRSEMDPPGYENTKKKKKKIFFFNFFFKWFSRSSFLCICMVIMVTCCWKAINSQAGLNIQAIGKVTLDTQTSHWETSQLRASQMICNESLLLLIYFYKSMSTF